jgi:hypothetical protein
VTESRDVDAVPHFPRHSDRWTEWGWPEQTPTDPDACARARDPEPDPRKDNHQ